MTNGVNESASPKQTVTFCITELDVGGAEKALVRIALGLKSLGWIVSVISLRDAGPLASRLKSGGIPVTALNCRGFWDIRAIWRLQSALQKDMPDCLVTFLHHANIAGRIAGRLARVKRIVCGVRVADRRWWVVWTDRMTRRFVSEYVAVSQQVAEVHCRLCRIPREMMTAICNGVDMPLTRESPGEALVAHHDSPFRLLFVGRLATQKAPSAVVKAFSLLPGEIQSRSILTLAGDGPMKAQIQAEIRDLNLVDRIQVLGYRDDVPDLMRNADLLVLPSLWEGLPNVVLEAMAAGLPVVACDVDGVREIISHGETGWCVPVGDHGALAEAISAALEAPETRRRIAAAAQDVVNQKFTWDAAIQSYAKLLSTPR